MIIMIVILGLLFLTTQSTAAKCKAVALEGGGSHGAYEAGVIYALANLTAPGTVNWNYVTGVSAGALNALGVLQFSVGDELALGKFLINLWLSLNGSESVYKEWPGGLIVGLLFEKGLYDTNPLKTTLESDFKLGFHRSWSVGTTNLNTGLYETLNETLGVKETINAVLCSAAPPFYFPPRDFLNQVYADGGCIINLDAYTAIQRCLDVTTEDNIVVDLIYCTIGTPLPDDTKFKSIDVFERARQIRAYDKTVIYTYEAMVAYPQVYFRYIISPSKPFPGGIVPLDFDKANLEFEIQVGINDTIAALNSDKDARTVIRDLYLMNKQSTIYA